MHATDQAIFSVDAKGDGLKYQWQYRVESTSDWRNAKKGIGCNSSTISYQPVQSFRNGYQFRCQVTDINGNVAYSAIATLTVSPNLTILEQPISIDITPGNIAIFSVKAEGPSLSYRWECRSRISELWTPVKDSGAHTDTLTLESKLTNHNGYQFRCKIMDDKGNILFSDIVTLNTTSVLATI